MMQQLNMDTPDDDPWWFHIIKNQQLAHKIYI